MLKLKVQYFGYLIWTADSLEKTMILAKIEGKRKRGHWGRRWLNGITYLMEMSVSTLQEIVKDRRAWHATIHEVTKNLTQLIDWTTTTFMLNVLCNPEMKCHSISWYRFLVLFFMPHQSLDGKEFVKFQGPVAVYLNLFSLIISILWAFVSGISINSWQKQKHSRCKKWKWN